VLYKALALLIPKMNHSTINRIALTPGEPAGIGVDLCVQLSRSQQSAELVVIADPDLLYQRAKKLGLDLTINLFNAANSQQINPVGSLTVLPVKLNQPVTPGYLNASNSRYVIDTITIATQGCLDGQFNAMVTAPVHKGIINQAGIPFTGHTELIADLTGGHPVMMLATADLRVALVTTHLPLSQVSQTITPDRLTTIINVLNSDLKQRFLLTKPHILVCGLNPHAGENGHLGGEEIEIIGPVIQQLKNQGLNLQGPLPADTVFTEKYLSKADVVLAMYHDQGLPVLKYVGFGQAVNITLGLPIIRTSVDHGTALTLAGTGQAHIGSLQLAISTALEMIQANNRCF